MDSRTKRLRSVIRIVIAMALGAAIVLAIVRSVASPPAASDMGTDSFRVTLTATEKHDKNERAEGCSTLRRPLGTKHTSRAVFTIEILSNRPFHPRQ